MSRADGVVTAPAFLIKKQFELAEEQISEDPQMLRTWAPILNQYGPSLLVQCDESIRLSKRLVESWLGQYMFGGDKDAAVKASRLADYLSNWDNFGSHERAVTMTDLEREGAAVVHLRDDEAFSDAVWGAWNGVSLTMANTGLVKLFENSRGGTRLMQQQMIGIQQAPSPPAIGTRKQRRNEKFGRN